MSDLYVMRLASGELFSVPAAHGRAIPIWTSADSTTHFKVHNPELQLYRACRIDARLLNSKLRPLAEQGFQFFFPDLDPYNLGLRNGAFKTLEEVEGIISRLGDAPPLAT